MPTDPFFPEDDDAAAAEGEELRDEGMENVQRGVFPEFIACFEGALRAVAQRRLRFTTDAVRYVMERYGCSKPRDWRILGPMMKRAEGWGWIELTNEFHESVRPECHRRPLRVYVSLLYRGPTKEVTDDRRTG